MDYKNVTRKVNDLIPYVNNSRTHSDEQVTQIASSIKEFGFTNPVLIDIDDGIIAGHGRIMAAKKLGIEEVPCIVLEGFTEAQKKAYVIADNQLALSSEWNIELLKVELEALEEMDFDIDILGFDDAFIDELDLSIDETEEGLTDEDSIPDEPEVPISKKGDIWVLGNHRLMCGDSTSDSDVNTLMNGNKADILFSSPPYNVGKTPNGNDQKYINDIDNKSILEYSSLLNDFVLNALNHTDYVFSNIQSLSGNKVALIEHLYKLKDKYADVIIWDKKTAEPAMARKVLNSQFEYVHVFSNDAKRSIGNRDFRGTLSNIIYINSRKGKDYAKVHKATFPVELPTYFIENFTESSIIDLFGGTGTTLIASEKTNRKCYMMELSEIYIDIIIKRYQEYTGKDAILESNGKTYNELSNG